MRHYVCLLAFLFLFLCGCQTSSAGNSNAQLIASSTSNQKPKVLVEGMTASYFEFVPEGLRIPAPPFRLKLTQEGKKLDGEIRYSETKVSHPISGEIDEQGKIILKEVDESGQVVATLEGMLVPRMK